MSYKPKSKTAKLTVGQIQLVLVIAFIIGSFLVSALLKSTYTPPGENKSADRVLVVEAVEIAPTSHLIAFETTGVIEARNSINIVPQVSGRVTSVHEGFFSGGSFEKGDTLFTIEPRDFELEVRRQKAEVARASTALELEEAESKAALEEWKQRNGSKKAPALVIRKPQLSEAKANLESAKALLENAELDLERSRFTLSFNGRVISSQISQDQYVQAGQSYGEVFDQAELEINASLEDTQLKWLMRADAPEITIRAEYLGEKREFQGILKRGVSALDAGTRFATVRFGFKERNDDLLPGIFSDIEVLGPNIEGVMVLPSSALQAQNTVWRLEGDQLKVWKPAIIYANENYLVVEGLDEPTKIVTTGVPGGTDGMRVKVADSLEKEGA